MRLSYIGGLAFLLFCLSTMSLFILLQERLLDMSNDSNLKVNLSKNRTISKVLLGAVINWKPFVPKRVTRVRQNVNAVLTTSDYSGRLYASGGISTDTLNALKKAAMSSTSRERPVIAVLVLSCNRPTLQRCLDQLLLFRKVKDQFPIVVSRDCRHKPTAKIIDKYRRNVFSVEQPDQSPIMVNGSELNNLPYYKIARHYRWALNQMFFTFGFETVLVVEDDLDVAPDFYEYFLGTLPLLQTDPTLWCVSAWNDNGRAGRVDLQAPKLLYRTDFFPGLGWMLTRQLWSELAPRWPESYWDDWMRRPEQRLGRACVRPELSRTRNLGRKGTNTEYFFDNFIRNVYLNEVYVHFTETDLSYLRKEIYDVNFQREVYSSPVVNASDLIDSRMKHFSRNVRISYSNKVEFVMYTKMFGLMSDLRSGVPRTAYRGVVSFMHGSVRVFLAPSSNWTGYDW